ncbi:MAG: PAS domain-containing protein [Anaerolineales bacterium]|nr:PAS domain-containing protein [Anaerolineales bacterium]
MQQVWYSDICSHDNFVTWQLTLFSLIFFLATLVAVVLLIYALQHKNVKGATYFVFLLASVIAWVFFQALEYAVLEPQNKILFTKFQYFGISTIGLTWYLFAVNYSNRETWLSRNYPLFLIFSALAILLAFTNDSHRLVWPEIRPASVEPGAPMIYEHGPAFWAMFVYIYVLFFAGTYVILKTALTSREIYRSQAVGLVTSAILPWIGNILYVADLTPIPGLDLTSLGFAASTIVLAWSIFSLRLFDLAPVARGQLMENLVDGVIVLDSENRVVEINPQAREFLKIGNQPTLGRNVNDFLIPWREVVAQFRDMQSGQAEVHLDGQELTDIDVRISPLIDEQKRPAGRIITIRDISTQKKLERARENLTRSIVRDLHTPLTSVALALETLRRQSGSFSREQSETVDSIRQNVQHMLDLVDSILDVYRLEQGKMPLNRKRVSMQFLVAEAVRSVPALANQKRILVQTDLPQEMPPLYVDPNLIRRVLQNLLDYSVRIASEGRIVRIQAGFEYIKGAPVISVIDLGSDGVLESASFEKYHPGSVALNEDEIGLAFCRLAVQAHGGSIWIDERYKNGTKISFTLPDSLS